MIMLTTRTFNSAINPWLNHQIGVTVTRNAVFPVFHGDTITGFCKSDFQVQIFRLIGFGATPQAAERMAKRAGWNTAQIAPEKETCKSEI